MSREWSQRFREPQRRGRAGSRLSGGLLQPRRGQRRWRGLVAAAGAASLLWIALAAGWFSLDPLARISQVRVTIRGAVSLTREEVLDALALPPGTSFLELDWAQVRQRIESLPRVRRAHLSYGWLHRLCVQVEERSAVALVLRPDGKALEVCGEGVLMSPRGRSLSDLPLLSWATTVPAGQVAAGERLGMKGVQELLGLLADVQRGHPLLWDGISEARILRDGAYELFSNDVPIVVWGRGSVSEMRLRAWAGVIGDLRRRGESDAVIDLRFYEQILVRLPGETGAVSGEVG